MSYSGPGMCWICYVEQNLPLGFFCPTTDMDGGYGQNVYYIAGRRGGDGSSFQKRIEAGGSNIANVAKFNRIRRQKMVASGLWTESNLDGRIHSQNLLDLLGL